MTPTKTGIACAACLAIGFGLPFVNQTPKSKPSERATSPLVTFSSAPQPGLCTYSDGGTWPCPPTHAEAVRTVYPVCCRVWWLNQHACWVKPGSAAEMNAWRECGNQ